MKMTKIKTFTTLLFFILCGTFADAQTKIIAHRGYWKCEGSAQNSIEALKRAGEEKVYGSEFDVLITADGIPVVNHDATINGISIENSPYSQIKDIKLSNGETLPTLEEYLQEGKKHKNLKLILEIKSHKKEVNENRAAKEIVDLVKRMKLRNQVEYISFSKNICRQLRALDKRSKIAYLNGDMSPIEVKKEGWSGIDYNHSVLSNNPEWIEQAKNNNVSINVWTVNSEEDLKNFIEKKVDFITTDNPVKALELAK